MAWRSSKDGGWPGRCAAHEAETAAKFLAKESSAGFAARFEAYVEAAAAFADGAEDGGGASLQGIGSGVMGRGGVAAETPVKGNAEPVWAPDTLDVAPVA